MRRSGAGSYLDTAIAVNKTEPMVAAAGDGPRAFSAGPTETRDVPPCE